MGESSRFAYSVDQAGRFRAESCKVPSTPSGVDSVVDQAGSGVHHRSEKAAAVLEKNLPPHQVTYCSALPVAGLRSCCGRSPMPSEASKKDREDLTAVVGHLVRAGHDTSRGRLRIRVASEIDK